MKLAKPKSLIFLPQIRCMPLRFSVSNIITSYRSVRSCASLKWKSLRWFCSFLCSLASSIRAFCLFFDPRRLRERLRLAFRMSLSRSLKNCGDCISLPSDAVRYVLSPKSKPTISPVLADSLDPTASVTKNRYISPSGSRLTVRSFMFPSISLDLKYLYTRLPMRMLLPSSSLYPVCFRENDLYFRRFLNEGGAALTPALRFRKNSLYALSIRCVISWIAWEFRHFQWPYLGSFLSLVICF